MSFCVATFGEHPAAIPPTPAIFRKVRRPSPVWCSSDTMSSLVAGHALCEAGALGRPLRLLPLVALEAPAHAERRHLAHDLHLLHLAVALPAGHAGAHVALVREEDVVGYAVNADPLDGLVLVQLPEERLELRGHRRRVHVFLDELVAPAAARHGRDSGHRPALGVGVARRAADRRVARVSLAAELDGLWRRWRQALVEDGEESSGGT